MKYYTSNKHYIKFLNRETRLQKVIDKNEAELIIADVKNINLNHYRDIKYVVCPCTNTNHIINKNNIPIISLEGETEFLKSITSTAEHTFRLMLDLSRNLNLETPLYERPDKPGNTLSGKVLGIIGYGRIGKQVKAIAEAFGMKVQTIDINDSKLKLNNLLSTSDIISLHTSIKENQHPILGESEFNIIKDNCILINTTRSEAIDQVALCNKLSKFKGVGLDVISNDNKTRFLLSISGKCIITPHIGGYTYEDLDTTFQFCMNKFFKEFYI